MAYEIVSQLHEGKISATLELPSRRPAKMVLLRFRHPSVVPIRSVDVNGKPWSDFDRDKETIRLTGLSGAVVVRASY